jgi:hypothetical protein
VIKVRSGVSPERILPPSSAPIRFILIFTNSFNPMNLPSFQFLQLLQPPSTTVSSPKLDLIALTWEHITNRYLQRIESNRILVGRVRSIRLLAVHDAIQSVIDPGNGYIYKEISNGSTIEASFAAIVQSSHDILAAVFDDPSDRADLSDLLEESLGLIGNSDEKIAGTVSGARSATTYVGAFSTLLKQSGQRSHVPRVDSSPLAIAGHNRYARTPEWRRSA